MILFQEVDKFHDLEEELRLRGYSGIWKVVTNTSALSLLTTALLIAIFSLSLSFSS